MKHSRPHPETRLSGYLLTEALVYISVVMLLLGIGYAAMYRCINSSLALRRAAEDTARALNAGERWRADVRNATALEWAVVDGMQVLRLEGCGQGHAYAFDNGTLSRRSGSGPWVPVLSNVKNSSMHSDKRQQVVAWRWELELVTRTKSARVRPLFTFTAVPANTIQP
ncbi:MAG TPA: hypothetical protein VN673_14385 [Clostridia bacterium]|nr:hypothetical protein [Clostridia bacterium]